MPLLREGVYELLGAALSLESPLRHARSPVAFLEALLRYGHDPHGYYLQGPHLEEGQQYFFLHPEFVVGERLLQSHSSSVLSLLLRAPTHTRSLAGSSCGPYYRIGEPAETNMRPHAGLTLRRKPQGHVVDRNSCSHRRRNSCRTVGADNP